MERPVLLHTFALMLGILCAFYVKNIYGVLIAIALESALLILFYRFLKACGIKMRRVVIFGTIIFSIVGSVQYLWLDSANNNSFKQFNGQKIEALGMIKTDGEIGPKSTKYLFEIVSIKVLDSGVSGSFTKQLSETGTVILYISNNGNASKYLYGDILRISGALEKPRGASNPGGFDFSLYLKSLGVTASVFSNENEVRFFGENQGSWLVKLGIEIRKKIVGVSEKIFHTQQAGLLNGMLIGYREGLSKAVQQAFSDAGLTHIMAVSGANIVFIILPVVYLLKRTGMKKRRINLAIIALLCIFILVTGFQPSVMRAVLMADIVLVGQMMRRDSDFFSSISFAAMLLLLFNPYCIFDVGFSLSFAATLSMVMFYDKIKQKIDNRFIPEVLKDVIAGTMAAQIGTIPITLYYFNTLQVVSIVANILVVPITGIITVLGFITVGLGQMNLFVAKLLGVFVNYLISFILIITKYSSEFDYSILHLKTPSKLFVIIYVLLGILIYLIPNKVRIHKYKIISALVVFVILNIGIGIWLSKLEIYYLDVGQGDSALVKTVSGKSILIDGGGLSGETDKGEMVVVPFLYDYVGTTLDMVISTHPDADHIAGLMTVVKSLQVKKVIIPNCESQKYDEFTNLCQLEKIPIVKMSQGESIIMGDGTCMDIINPLNREIATDKTLKGLEDTNVNCIGVNLKYRNTAFLFMGDIPTAIEKEIVADNIGIKADIVKVGHHGAKTSSSLEFIEKVSPKFAIISVGKNNYGHPSRETLDLLQSENVKYFRTDRDGAIVVSTDGRKIAISKTLQE